MLSCNCAEPLLLRCCFFNDTATTEIYTLSLHDALPISVVAVSNDTATTEIYTLSLHDALPRSEEHTSELQSHSHLVCRLLLDNNKKLGFIQDDELRQPGPDSQLPDVPEQ